MSKSKWDEQDIEKLLNKMPKQSDHRTKEQFFHQLQQKGLFDEATHSSEDTHPNKTNKRIIQRRVKRGMALVATFVLVLLIPMVLFIINSNQQEVATDNSDKKLEMSDTDMAQMNQESEQIKINTLPDRQMDLRTGLYEDEVVDETIFYLGLAGDAAESIPVAFKIPTSWLNANGLDMEQSTYLDLYNKVIGLIDEELLGFPDYHPLVGRLEEKGNTLIHYLPMDHPYDKGTASTTNYFGVIQDTFGHHYDELMILAEDGSPGAFDHMGIITEPIKISSLKQTAYFLDSSSDNTLYLNTNSRTSFKTIEEAIAALSEKTNDLYQSPLISEASFTYNVVNSELVITFDKPLDVTVYQEDLLMAMFESLIFTAASFDLTIRFENIQQAIWGGFNFTEAIPHPISVNEQMVAF
jgi:hypothetical protein